ALCGDYRSEHGISYSTPVDAFVLIVIEVRRHYSQPWSASQIIKIIDGLFERNGWGSVAASIKKAHCENKDFLVAMKEKYVDTQEYRNVRSCIDAFENYLQLQEEMISWFLTNPGNYFDLRRYCGSMYSLPAPLIFIETEKKLPFHPKQLSRFNL